MDEQRSCTHRPGGARVVPVAHFQGGCSSHGQTGLLHLVVEFGPGDIGSLAMTAAVRAVFCMNEEAAASADQG